MQQLTSARAACPLRSASLSISLHSSTKNRISRPLRSLGSEQRARGSSSQPVRAASTLAPTDMQQVQPEAGRPTACGTLIVGGGPAGYGAAMMLAQQGHRDIVVLERNESAEWYDGGKAYAYNIDFRGKAFLESIGINSLDNIGVSGPLVITYIETDGRLHEKTPPGGAFAGKNKEGKPVAGGTWVSRHSFVSRLYEHALQHHSDAIRVQFGVSVTQVELPGEDGKGQIRVHAAGAGSSSVWAPKLLIAADGMKSIVRSELHKRHPSGEFDIVRVPSDAAGLAFKLVASSDRRFNNDKAVVLPGVDLGDGHALRMGMLPNKALDEPRSANFIQWPHHSFFQNVKTVDDLYSYLERAFPQLNVRHVVTKEEAERFVQADLGFFPQPQYCPTLVKSYPLCDAPAIEDTDPLASTQGSAVLLLGDAAHAFPPDLGQGVNSALQDVAVLRECLAEQTSSGAGDVHGALALFQERRMPDICALIRLMQIGAPYQYRQANKALNKALWTGNFMVRLALHKLLPSVVQQPAFANLSYSPSYSEILEASDRTTAVLRVMAVVLAALAAVLIKSLIG